MKKFLQDLMMLFGVLVVVSPIVLWAGDQHYVTVDSLEDNLAQFRLAQLNDSIWELETKVKYGEATKSEELKLKRQIDQRSEILSSGQL